MSVRNEHDLPIANTPSLRRADREVSSRRRAATEAHLQAINTINALFDCVDELIEARVRLPAVVPLGADDDPIRDVQELVQHAELLNQTLAAVRVAAVDASAHRRRSDIAADLGTELNLLFPMPGLRVCAIACEEDGRVKSSDDEARNDSTSDS
jgi:hypothetical protein